MIAGAWMPVSLRNQPSTLAAPVPARDLPRPAASLSARRRAGPVPPVPASESESAQPGLSGGHFDTASYSETVTVTVKGHPARRAQRRRPPGDSIESESAGEPGPARPARGPGARGSRVQADGHGLRITIESGSESDTDPSKCMNIPSIPSHDVCRVSLKLPVPGTRVPGKPSGHLSRSGNVTNLKLRPAQWASPKCMTAWILSAGKIPVLEFTLPAILSRCGPTRARESNCQKILTRRNGSD